MTDLEFLIVGLLVQAGRERVSRTVRTIPSGAGDRRARDPIHAAAVDQALAISYAVNEIRPAWDKSARARERARHRYVPAEIERLAADLRRVRTAVANPGEPLRARRFVSALE